MNKCNRCGHTERKHTEETFVPGRLACTAVGSRKYETLCPCDGFNAPEIVLYDKYGSAEYRSLVGRRCKK